MAQQTAVEWLLGTLEQNDIIDLDSVDSNKYYDIINQAKQMEKEQTEISDEEIEKAAYKYSGTLPYDNDFDAFQGGAKWYREQLKNK